jgi:hypothetical protein
MATLNVQNVNINTNVASSNNRVTFRFAQGQITSDVIDQPIETFVNLDCQEGLLFYCPDNSMYLPLI